jgi:hypothetical protein
MAEHALPPRRLQPPEGQLPTSNPQRVQLCRPRGEIAGGPQFPGGGRATQLPTPPSKENNYQYCDQIWPNTITAIVFPTGQTDLPISGALVFNGWGD